MRTNTLKRLIIAAGLILQVAATQVGAQVSYPEDGWWWDSNAAGRGYFIERQKDHIFVAAFIYADDGSPEWLTANGEYLPADPESDQIGSFTGKVYRNYDGQCIGCDHVLPVEAISEQSPLHITFSDNQHAVMEWFGESIPLSRFLWSWGNAADQLTGSWILIRLEDGNTSSQLVTIAATASTGSASISDAVTASEVGSIELFDNDLFLTLIDASEDELPLVIPESKRFYAGYGNAGALQVVAMRLDDLPLVVFDEVTGEAQGYAIVDTGQLKCYAATGSVITCPALNAAFYGQDAQHTGNTPDFTDNGNGTVSDNITGLMWQQSPDTNADTNIDVNDKLTYSEAQTYCDNLNLAGNTDWWLPDIKQLYSLIDFSGTDPSGYEGADTAGLTPFIDTSYFNFGYGDTSAGERIIDAQYASNTPYVANTANDGNGTLFGVNFADGRIKGYGLSLFGQDKTFYVICARGNSNYGQNDFTANNDGTISDKSSGLMWAQQDSTSSYNWEEALNRVEQQNAANYLGHNDWRLPNAKELQSLVDYTRAPDTSNSAAIDPLFSATSIVNEAGVADYPAYWTSTTHVNWTSNPGATGVYVNFGRSMGYMNNNWVDVHGAGAQRSDPKSGDPADYPTGRGPQGDAIRIYNHVRLVRSTH